MATQKDVVQAKCSMAILYLTLGATVLAAVVGAGASRSTHGATRVGRGGGPRVAMPCLAET